MNNEDRIKEVIESKYGEYKCLADGAISYKVNGNTRRLKFTKLYEELQGYGVTATPEDTIEVVFKYRANTSRVNVDN
jgi:hypothetical protein